MTRIQKVARAALLTLAPVAVVIATAAPRVKW